MKAEELKYLLQRAYLEGYSQKEQGGAYNFDAYYEYLMNHNAKQSSIITASDLYYTKIRVTPEESERVQKKAFELGFRWGYVQDSRSVNNTDKPFLYFWASGDMFYGINSDGFKLDPFREITLKDIFG